MTADSLNPRTRWIAFVVLCLGDFMIVLDATIVNVALPTIRDSLGFTEGSLVWVLNAYLLTFGGFLLLGGRLADIYGRRRLFLTGLALFTLASLACGLAGTQGVLIAARAIQGVGGAVVSAVALSLIMALFPEGPERVRAMGYFGFVMAGGGSVGVLAGGVLTAAFDWRSIFLVNLPVGAAVFFAALRMLPRDGARRAGQRLDVAGAVTVTAALLLAVYAIVDGEYAGWTSAQTLGLLAGAVVLLAAFVVVEARTPAPLVPLGLFRGRNLATANGVSVLWAGAMFAWFFLSALYMQLVLGYGPMAVGLAFLPANLIMGAFSWSLSARQVNRFGVRASLTTGLAFAAAGLLTFAFAPADGSYVLHVLPGMLLMGLGTGMSINPVLLAATNDVAEADSGLASGVVNTAFMMGGSLGLAILASIAAARTGALRAAGAAPEAALSSGYNAAFLAGALCAAAACLLSGLLLRDRPSAAGAGSSPAAHI